MRCPNCQRNNSFIKDRKSLDINSSSYSQDLLNYILNRVLLACVIGCFVAFGIFVGIILFQDASKALYIRTSHDKIVAKLEKYYEKEQFLQMYTYMQDNDLYYESDFDEYRQAATLGCDYNAYMTNKLQFLEKEESEQERYSYYLNSAIYYATKVYTSYDEPETLDRRNLALLNTYQKEIESFLKGTCAFQKEEIDKLLSKEERVYYSDIEEVYLPIAMEREGWKDEMD